MVNDIQADTLARIKNGIERKKSEVRILKSKVVKAILDVISQEGFIGEITEDEGEYVVELLYHKNGESKITKLEKVSKAGQRIYVSKKEILPVMNGRGIAVISTSKGMMTGAQAKANSLGGEYICKIW